MSTKRSSLKQKKSNVTDQGAKHQDIELTEFTMYAKSVPELRRHILPYCNNSSLFNYSQLSKTCNSEIQIFNTVPPEKLTLTEEENGVVVLMEYAHKSDWQLPHKKIAKKFLFSDFEDVMEEVQKYLRKYYKYVGPKNTWALTIDLKRMPINIMKMHHIAKIGNLIVTFSKSVYNEWMECFKNIDVKKICLTLHDCDEISERVTMPAEFFKSDVFRDLRDPYLHVKCEIESEDFINSEGKDILLRASISSDDIRAKVIRWNRTSHKEGCLYFIKMPDDDDRVFDVYDIFPANQFVHELFEDQEDDDCVEFAIEKVVVKQMANGKMLRLHFVGDEEHIFLFDF